MKIKASPALKLLALVTALVTTPALSQTISPQESASPYANVRGWSVYSMSDGRGNFSCRAVRGRGYNNEMMLEYDGFDQTWRILVQGTRPSGGGGGGAKGAGVYYDGRFVDRQIYFGSPGYDGASDTHAKLDLNADGLRKVKSGNTIRIDINGESARSWSLSGTTAAILKIAECASVNGYAPAGMAAAAPTRNTAPAPTRGTVTPRAQVQPQQQAQQAFNANGIGYVVFPQGEYVHTGNGNWVEQGNNGSAFYFSEYDSTDDSIFLNDTSRDLQIWIDFHNNDILYTRNFNANTWTRLYTIDCYDATRSRSC
jgi:hypothetical protein